MLRPTRACCQTTSPVLFRRQRTFLPYQHTGVINARCYSSGEERSPEQNREDNKYCMNLVMERDREGFLCGLLLPSKAQKSYFAIRAFNVELASVKDGHNLRHHPTEQSTQPGTMDTPTSLALKMRMQWWRDALSEIYEDEDRQLLSGMARNMSISAWHSPVVRSLALAHQECNLTRRFLERLIDAREMDLDLNQYETMEDVIKYAEDSVSSLMYLSLECSGVKDDGADEVAYHAGIGIGLVTAIRATPFRLRHGEVPLPANLFVPDFPYTEIVRSMSNSDQDSEITWTRQHASIWEDAIRYTVDVASSHLSRVQQLQGQVPRQGKPALLPIVPSIYYLDRLKASDYNIFDSSLNEQSKRLGLLLLLGRSWLTGTV